MSLFKVDLEKCVRCGACAAECPSQIIGVDEQKGPMRQNKRTCIACGHCVAVCPTAALDNRRSPLAEHVELGEWSLPSEDEMEKLLRSRRSVRAYHDKTVEPEKLRKLLELARYAQTAGNSQGLSFISISDRSFIKEIVEAVVCWLERLIAQDDDRAQYLAGVVGHWREHGYDSILRGAPNLLVAIAPAEHKNAESNCSFVWSYAELFAPALGLGTCIAGFTQRCAFQGDERLLALLDLPDNMKVAGVLMVGYPRFKYKRLPPRQPLKMYTFSMGVKTIDFE